MKVPCRVLPHGEGLGLPAYATEHAAGMDLLAAVERERVVEPGERTLIPTGLVLAIPPGFEGQIRPRSGLALRSPLLLPNSPGTVDADYRGEVMVLVMNTGRDPFPVPRGMRIAQMVFAPCARAELDTSAPLPPSGRGEGGFGHTGS